MSFRRKFWRTIRIFGGIFLIMFLFRLGYGYFNNSYEISDHGYDFFESLDNVRRNYASEKMAMKAPSYSGAPIQANQKYEKTARARAKSSRFSEEENQTRKLVKAFSAIIQYEQKKGREGSRAVHLLIGVDPSRFDEFYAGIQKIGTLLSTEVTKVDKTNEYRQLNAQKSSLEKTLSSLNELKAKGGAINDFVGLHDKILEIETKLQELGVELGNFDAENEFCTVRFSLFEGATAQTISFWRRVKVALEWTIKYYGLFILCVMATMITVFILLLIIEKLKLLSSAYGSKD